ncbi:GntT/GntP/DsdX family permease [Staphylococcus pasteuri]|nr:hypothetical protein [Staphylococcus pasteuri]
MVVGIGGGSVMLCDVNEGGLWMLREYFGLRVKESFLSW